MEAEAKVKEAKAQAIAKKLVKEAEAAKAPEESAESTEVTESTETPAAE